MTHTPNTDQRESRADLSPALCKVAECFCIYDMTDGFCHPRNKDRSGGYSLFNKGNGLIYPDFLSFSPMPIVADAKYKPFENIKGTDYLQLVAYMYRFDAKLGFYLFPNATTEQHSQQFELLQGKGQKREDKIIVEKLGLTIPQQMTSFDAFVLAMQANEAQFLERIQLEM